MSKLTPGDHRAYTLKPHWAHAIAHLGKRCENRTTPPPKGLVGKRVAIHAGASLPSTWFSDLERFGVDHQGGDLVQGIYRSSIVATAILKSCASPERDSIELSDLYWTEWAMAGFFWWQLDAIVPLLHPVPIKRGAQGPWRLTPEQVAAINAQGGGL